MKELNLNSDSLIKLFFYYFLPSLFSMLAMSTYAFVDGFFVSHALGENAVAALGITWPVFPTLIACELLFAIGGAALISYFLGRNESETARKVFSSIIYFILIFGIFVSIVLFVFVREISLFLGASPQIEEMVVGYLEVIFAGAFLLFLHPILDMFAVNDKRPILAMIAMLIASFGNIVFNYLFLFVFDLGIQASALSTILGNAIASIILLWHFFSKKGDLFFIKVLDLGLVFSSAKNGIPSSISELSAGIMMLIYNLVLIQEMGERGIVIYTVTMYGGILFFTVLLSIAQGIQPIASFNYGAHNLLRVKKIYRLGILFSLVASIGIYTAFYVWGEEFAKAFLDSKRMGLSDTSLTKEISSVIKIWFIAYFALGINMLSSIFLQSIQRPWGALLITLSYTLILTPIFLFLLKDHFGELGIWIAYPLASVLAIFITIPVLLFELKKGVLAQCREKQ